MNMFLVAFSWFFLVYCGSSAQKVQTPLPSQSSPTPLDQMPAEQESATSPALNNADLKIKTSTNVSLGLKFLESNIDIVQGDLLTEKKELTNLWVTKLDNYSVFDNGNNDPDINSVLDDFSQCGFEYAGPSCKEGQEKQEVASGMFSSEGKKYIFFSFSYESESEKTYALLFPLREKLKTFPDSQDAYLYLIKDPLKAHSAADIFSQKIASSIATLHFSKLTLDVVSSAIRSDSTMRQKLRLLHYQADLKKLFNESSPQTITLPELAKQLQNYSIDYNAVFETGDNNTTLLYILYHEKMLTLNDFRAYLTDIALHAKASTLTIHAQLALLRRGQIDDKKYQVLIDAFTKGDKDLVRIAFWSLNYLDKIPISIRNSLVKLLGEVRTSLVRKTEKLLIKYGIEPSTVPLIVTTIAKKSKQEATINSAFNILEASYLYEVNHDVLRLLEHDNSELREKVRLFLLRRTIEEELLPDLADLFLSQYSNVQYLGLELVNELKSEEATLVLIRNSTIDSDFRHAITAKMIERTNFSDMHVDALAVLFKSRFKELGPIAVELLLKIKTPKAANPLLDWLFNEKDINFRKKIIDGLYQFTFSEINIAPQRYRYYVKDERYQAVLDYLMMIPGDIDDASDVVIKYIRSAQNDSQIEQIFNYLDGRSLGGNCAISLMDFFDYPKPETEYFVNKSMEYISRIPGKEAQIALATIMGKPTADFRIWAIDELDRRDIDPSIGKIFSNYITGELHWPQMSYLGAEQPQRLKRTKFLETLEAAKKFLLRSKSPEGFKQIIYELSNKEYATYNSINNQDRDEFTNLLKEYFLSTIPEKLPEIVTKELVDAIKRSYGDEYGRTQILRLLPMVPDESIVAALKKEIDFAKDKTQPIIVLMTEIVAEMKKL